LTAKISVLLYHRPTVKNDPAFRHPGTQQTRPASQWWEEKKPLPELSIRKNKLTTLYLSNAYDASEVESPVTEGEMLVLARSLQSLPTKPPRNMNWKEK